MGNKPGGPVQALHERIRLVVEFEESRYELLAGIKGKSSKAKYYDDLRGDLNIYVGNLSLELTENELRHEFMHFGEVLSVTIMNDQYIGSGQGHGYGFVEMPIKSEAQAAISSLTGKAVKGRVITVIEALQLSHTMNINSRGTDRFSRNGRTGKAISQRQHLEKCDLD